MLVEHVTSNPWVETVLYTDFNSAGKVDGPAPAQLAEHALASVSKAEEGKDAITYLANAIASGIETPLTSTYNAEILRRTATNNLQEALSKARKDGGAREAGTNE